ncbi:MAG: sigma-70 family RNA polymerase sigma factor [Actinomycetota bacterium]|nr:sigma-70 family RNA polymerase sigma factor [Actinomycetota bacterium]
MGTQPESSFEAVWPELARRINRFLTSKKVPDSQREDVVQETGLRLYRMWDQVDPSGSPVGLALTIAMNIVRDNARRDSHRAVVEIEPELAAVCDVERSGLARLELSRVHRALSELTPAQRSVLLSELDRNERTPQASPAAIKMLRMRARRNLTAILERAGCGVLVARWRRLLGLPQEMLVARDVSKVEQGLASSLAGVMAAAAISLTPLTLPAIIGSEDPGGAGGGARRGASDGLWLSSAMEAVGAAVPDARVAAPRPQNLGGESNLVRVSSGRAKLGRARGKGRPAEHQPMVEVPLPNGEGEIEGDGTVEVNAEPPELDPGNDQPLGCVPTEPGCSVAPEDPGQVTASVKVTIRGTTVSASVDSDDVVAAVDLGG